MRLSSIRWNLRNLLPLVAETQRQRWPRSELLFSSLLERLPDVVANVRRRNSPAYQRWVKGNVPIITVLFGAVPAGGITTATLCQFLLAGNEIKPDCSAAVKNFAWMMGTNKTATFLFTTNPTAFGNSAARNPVDFVRSIVELEIATSRLLNTGDVGAPISIARFDVTGLHFIERGVCPADQGNKQNNK